MRPVVGPSAPRSLRSRGARHLLEELPEEIGKISGVFVSGVFDHCFAILVLVDGICDAFCIEPRDIGDVEDRGHHVQVRDGGFFVGYEVTAAQCSELKRAGVVSAAAVCVDEVADDTVSAARCGSDDLGQALLLRVVGQGIAAGIWHRSRSFRCT